MVSRKGPAPKPAVRQFPFATICMRTTHGDSGIRFHDDLARALAVAESSSCGERCQGVHELVWRDSDRIRVRQITRPAEPQRLPKPVLLDAEVLTVLPPGGPPPRRRRSAALRRVISPPLPTPTPLAAVPVAVPLAAPAPPLLRCHRGHQLPTGMKAKHCTECQRGDKRRKRKENQ
jgi:hypothetical protein